MISSYPVLSFLAFRTVFVCIAQRISNWSKQPPRSRSLDYACRDNPHSIIHVYLLDIRMLTTYICSLDDLRVFIEK